MLIIFFKSTEVSCFIQREIAKKLELKSLKVYQDLQWQLPIVTLLIQRTDNVSPIIPDKNSCKILKNNPYFLHLRNREQSVTCLALEISSDIK